MAMEEDEGGRPEWCNELLDCAQRFTGELMAIALAHGDTELRDLFADMGNILTIPVATMAARLREHSAQGTAAAIMITFVVKRLYDGGMVSREYAQAILDAIQAHYPDNPFAGMNVDNEA